MTAREVELWVDSIHFSALLRSFSNARSTFFPIRRNSSSSLVRLSDIRVVDCRYKMIVVGVLRILILSCIALSNSSSTILRWLEGTDTFYTAEKYIDIPFPLDSSSRSSVAWAKILQILDASKIFFRKSGTWELGESESSGIRPWGNEELAEDDELGIIRRLIFWRTHMSPA